jgi:hypothetical protein
MYIKALMANKIKWFVKDYLSRHTNKWDRILHLIGVPQAFFGIYQLICMRWKIGLINFFVGYLWQFIGHWHFEKNEVGELILLKKLLRFLQ